MNRAVCMSIAGFDPSGGAGILADIKAMEQNEVYGLGVSTCITYQSGECFEGVSWLDDEEILKQIEPLKNYKVQAVKIGLIKSFEQLSLIISAIKDYWPNAFVIWDPILKATAGFEFHSNPKLTNDLISKIDLITPNLMEYGKLGLESFKRKVNILLKGGHSDTQRGTDILMNGTKDIELKGEVFLKEIDKHGTGCVLSAAIASNIAKSFPMNEACAKAKQYVERFILSNNSKLGYHK